VLSVNIVACHGGRSTGARAADADAPGPAGAPRGGAAELRAVARETFSRLAPVLPVARPRVARGAIVDTNERLGSQLRHIRVAYTLTLFKG
jgi:hypothetical protein